MGEPTTPTKEEIHRKENEAIDEAPELSMYNLRKLAEHRGETVVLNNLYEELADLSAKVNILKEQRTNLYRYELTGRISTLKSDLEKLNTAKNKLQQQASKLLKLNQLKMMLQRNQKQLEQLNKERDNAPEEKVFELSKQIRDKVDRMTQIEKKVEKIEIKKANELKDLKDKINKLKAEIAEKTEFYDTYTQKLQEATEFINEQKKVRKEIEKVRQIITKVKDRTIPDGTFPEGVTLKTLRRTAESLVNETKDVGSLEKEAAKQKNLLASARKIIEDSENKKNLDQILKKIRQRIQAAIKKKPPIQIPSPKGKLQLRF